MGFKDKVIKGKRGEEISENFLLESGYSIVKKNYRKQSGEIDIIAEKGETIYFIEVKFWNSKFFFPLETFSKSKIKRMQLTAERFLAKNVSFQTHLVSFALISIEENEQIKFYSNLF